MSTASISQAPTGILGVFDDPRYAALAVDNATSTRRPIRSPTACTTTSCHRKAARPLAVIPETRLDGVGVRDNADNLRMYQHDETKFPPLYREMLRELNSRQFLLFLETLTGIDNLLPDPYFIGGGIHLSGRGRLPQHPRRLQLAPQAPGSSPGQRAHLPVRRLEAGVGRRRWSSGARDMTANGRLRLPGVQPHGGVLDERALPPRSASPELVPGGHLPQGLEPLLLHDRSRRRGSRRGSSLHEVQDVGVTLRDPTR